MNIIQKLDGSNNLSYLIFGIFIASNILLFLESSKKIIFPFHQTTDQCPATPSSQTISAMHLNHLSLTTKYHYFPEVFVHFL